MFTPPVLMVVAHWDDEVIIAGGTIALEAKGWDIACMTHRHIHPDYESIFNHVCWDIGANPIHIGIGQRIKPYDKSVSPREYKKNTPRTDLSDASSLKMFIDNVDIRKYNTIITHNPNGDLGAHPQHVQVSNLMTDLFFDRYIYYFVREPDRHWLNLNRARTYYIDNSDFSLMLDRKSYDKKIEFIRRYKPHYSYLMPDVEYYKKHVPGKCTFDIELCGDKFKYKGRLIDSLEKKFITLDINKDINDINNRVVKYREILRQYDDGKIDIKVECYDHYDKQRKKYVKRGQDLSEDFRLEMFMSLYEHFKKKMYLERPYHHHFLEVEKMGDKYYPWGEHRVAILQHLGYTKIKAIERVIT